MLIVMHDAVTGSRRATSQLIVKYWRRPYYRFQMRAVQQAGMAAIKLLSSRMRGKIKAIFISRDPPNQYHIIYQNRNHQINHKRQ